MQPPFGRRLSAAAAAALLLSCSSGLGLQIPGGPEEAATYIRTLQHSGVTGRWAKAQQLGGLPGNSSTFRTEQGGLAEARRTRTVVIDLVKQLCVPVAALLLGALVRAFGARSKVLSKVMMFFGAQTFMNIYMKAVLSQTVVSEEFKMRGFQAPLMLTALQQLVGFIFLSFMVGLSHVAGLPYRPKRISTLRELAILLSLSVTFTANIAGNNYSLAMLDMSANVMVRSLAPLTALTLQVTLQRWIGAAADTRWPKLLMVLGGVICTVLVVLSKRQGAPTGGSENYIFGILLCFASLFFASLELIIVAVIGGGESIKLNAIDTCLYMAIPIVVLLMIPILFFSHPVAYTHYGNTTDWHVFVEVCRLNGVVIVLVLLSGIWAVCYNLLLYTVVCDLSPVFATFGSSFNKAAAIALALLLQFEHLPRGVWGLIMVLGVVGNMFFFTAFALYPKQHAGGGSGDTKKLLPPTPGKKPGSD